MKKNTLLYTSAFLAIVIALMLINGKSVTTFAQDDSTVVKPPQQVVQPLVIADKMTDPFPKGCVSCHINTGKENEDYRLQTVMAATHPKHPKLSAVKIVPDDCKKCHTEGKKIGKLSEIIHKVHFSKMENGDFFKNFGGKCTHCHGIDSVDWRMKVKSGERNW